MADIIDTITTLPPISTKNNPIVPITADSILKRVNVIMSNNGRAVKGTGDESTPDNIYDSNWTRQTLRRGSVNFQDPKNNLFRFWSSADTKFEDTTIGGNFCINPRPQFTRYADTRSMGISGETKPVTVNHADTRLGMGHYYSEAINDTHQTIHMIFGQPEFNSLTSYFKNFFDIDSSNLANGGRFSQFLHDFFEKATEFFLCISFIEFTVFMAGLNVLQQAWRFLMRRPPSKYYYMRPNMKLYWQAVEIIVNKISTTSGMVAFGEDGNKFTALAESPTPPNQVTATTAQKKSGEMVGANFSDMFTPSGFINVRRIAGRANRMSNAYDKVLSEKMVSDDKEADLAAFMKDLYRGRVDQSFDTGRNEGQGGATFESIKKAIEDFEKTTNDYSELFHSEVIGDLKGESDSTTQQQKNSAPLESSFRLNRNTGDPVTKEEAESDTSWFGKAWKVWENEYNDGTAFATFRVDHTGNVDESFSNSTGESELASTINNMSASVRNASFNVAGGNLAGGMIGSVIDGVVSSLKGVVEGASKFFGIQGIFAPGNAFADIPEFWQNSAARLPTMSYSINLSSPSGDPLSRMMNIYIPLAMLLAAVLPKSTGKQSYTSPFLCQVFDQGRAITRLGIVDSLSINRGTSNLSFNKKRQFMSLEVTFTIKDLSSIMHMPIATDTFDLVNPMKGIFDEDTIFTDYMGVLSSLSLHRSYYLKEKLYINLLNKYTQAHTLLHADFWASLFHYDTPLGMLDAFGKQNNAW